MFLDPNRLKLAREALNINKAEAARLLSMSAMGYGRYESGQRSPSYQTICYIARIFNTSPEYLCGEAEGSQPDSILLNKSTDVDIFDMVSSMQENEELTRRMIKYYKELLSGK